jgi:peptide/nickel transport system substrate-binding protein
MNWTRKHSRRRAALLVTVVVLLLSVLLVAGCGGSSGGGSGGGGSASPSADQPIFRLGSVNDPYDSLNPFNVRYSSSFTALMLMYPNLVGFSSELEAIPDLAESWTASTDGKTWTFKLHPGAVWTDGEPITSADVVFTIETVLKYKDDAAAYLATFIPSVTGATAVDDATVELMLSAPSATLLSDIYLLPMLPKHVWAPLATGNGAKLKGPTMDPAKEEVVVAGPFTVEKLDVKGTTIYQRVDTFYGQKPLVTGYGFQVFTNADAAVQAIKTDQIDAAYFLPASSAAAFEGNAGFKVQGFGQLPWFLAPNCSKNFSAHPEMQDPKVRQALSLAINRQPLIESVNRGFAVTGGWPLLDAYSPQYLSQPMSVPSQDVATANQMLDDLGYTKGSDGIRVADGVKMSYEILVYAPWRATDGRSADLIVQDFAAIGVEARPKLLDDPYTAMWGNDYKDYAFLLTAWGVSPDPAGMLILATSGYLGVTNPTGFSDPTYDKLYDEQAAQIDPEKRKATIDQMAGILQDQQVYIPLYAGQVITAWSAKWTGVEDAGSALGFYMPLNKVIFNALAVQQ